MTLAARLRAAFDGPPAETPLVEDDYRWPGAFTPAAVLIAVTDAPEPAVVLTQRQASLRAHAGQIAFPGGRIDPTDDGPVAAALREAQEEIALDPAQAEVIGVGDRYRTGSGYAIAPVLAVIPPGLPLSPHEAEVAALFEVPLAHLLDPANHRPISAHLGGRTRHTFEIVWPDRRIWGITACLIVNLSRRLGGFA